MPRATRAFGITAIMGIGVLLLGPWMTASAEACYFQQYSPHLKQWFKVCQEQTDKQSCETISLRGMKSDPRIGTKGCASQGVLGACIVEGRPLYFYQGRASELAAGCKRMHGEWRPTLKPAAETP